MTKLEEILSYIKGKSVYVQMHNFPDPDAIASAYGMKKLLEAEGISAEIVYKGNIEKTVTSNMVFLLNINIDVHMATALLYGIKVDTADMKRGLTQLDLDMFYSLYNMADHKVLNKLDTSVRQYDDLKAYAYAIANLDVKKDACFASTGDNCQESLIASICDFIMSLDGIDFAVTYSAKKEGVKLSIRSSGVYDAGRISNNALKSIGNGGGHEHMAGGFISYSSLDNRDASYIRKVIEDKFLEELKG